MYSLVFVFYAAFLLAQQTHASSEVLDKSTLLCLHPTYPCYYYSCNYISFDNDLNNLPAFKCADGLIFDEELQRCTFALPWQTCNEDEISRKITVLKDNSIATISSNSAEIKLNNIETNFNVNPQVVESRDEPAAQSAQSKDITRDYLLNILTNFGKSNPDNAKLKSRKHNSPAYKSETNKLNLTYVSINEANLNLKSQKVLFHEKLSNFYPPVVSENSGRAIKFYNASLEDDQNFDQYDDESYKQLDQHDENNEYAFIIVPVKVAKQDRRPKLSRPNPKVISTEVLTPSTENLNDENMKGFQNMFQYKKVCYVTNWSQYRPKDGGYFTPDMIDPFLCTHIIYAFAYIDNVTLTIRTIEQNDEEMYRKLNDLKYKNPKLKTLLGVGGWNMESDEFSAMVSEKKTRLVFIYHAMKFLRHHGFDGIDLDWEFPADRGGVPEDKQRLSLFIHEFRQAINDEVLERNMERLVMSAAVAAGKNRIDKGYEIPQLAADLDFINLMSFDYHGSWDPRAGLNAPLYSHENETGDDMMLNQDWSVNYWISHGCPSHKLVLGVPAYGRTFTLKDEKENGIGADTSGSGLAGNFTKTPGFMAYYEICQLRKTKDWTTVWLSQSKSHYMFNKNQWVAYDDIKSFHLRTAYIVAKKLGGLFMWSLDMDDYSGKFCDMGAFPLIKNSMSLLMDYMPEFYSSNVNPAPKADVKSVSVSSDREPSSLIFLLKDDDEAPTSLPKTFGSTFMKTDTTSGPVKSLDSTNDIKNQIRSDLLRLLKQQPQKFLSYKLIEKFNCTDKLNGIHRDPYGCEKFYICNNNSDSMNTLQDEQHKLSTNQYTVLTSQNEKKQQEAEILREFSCPPNTEFTMTGCYCEKVDKNKRKLCPRLNETLCRKF